MKKTLDVLNKMLDARLFQKYAIGGGIAALFYIEPVVTFDLDVFVILPTRKATLISLRPIYDWLQHKGYQSKKEHIMIEGVPVQFIPAYNALIEESVRNAQERKYEDVTTFVIQKEYLIAIMLQTDRSKDRERILKIIDESELNNTLLENILDRFDLVDKYNDFKKKFNML